MRKAELAATAATEVNSGIMATDQQSRCASVPPPGMMTPSALFTDLRESPACADEWRDDAAPSPLPRGPVPQPLRALAPEIHQMATDQHGFIGRRWTQAAVEEQPNFKRSPCLPHRGVAWVVQ